MTAPTAARLGHGTRPATTRSRRRTGHQTAGASVGRHFWFVPLGPCWFGAVVGRALGGYAHTLRVRRRGALRSLRRRSVCNRRFVVRSRVRVRHGRRVPADASGAATVAMGGARLPWAVPASSARRSAGDHAAVTFRGRPRRAVGSSAITWPATTPVGRRLAGRVSSHSRHGVSAGQARHTSTAAHTAGTRQAWREGKCVAEVCPAHAVRPPVVSP